MFALNSCHFDHYNVLVFQSNKIESFVQTEPEKIIEREEVVESQPDEMRELRKTLQSLQDKISTKNQQIEQLVQEKTLLLKVRC